MSDTEVAKDSKELACYLRCVIYDLYILANSVYALKHEDDYGMQEVYKTAALIKLRTIHKFFFTEFTKDEMKNLDKAIDNIKKDCFKDYEPDLSNLMESPFKGNEPFINEKAINVFVCHLHTERCSKEYESCRGGGEIGDPIVQPKFKKGNTAVIDESVKLLIGAFDFVDSILRHKEFYGLNFWGHKYWNGFRETLEKLV